MKSNAKRNRKENYNTYTFMPVSLTRLVLIGGVTGSVWSRLDLDLGVRVSASLVDRDRDFLAAEVVAGLQVEVGEVRLVQTFDGQEYVCSVLTEGLKTWERYGDENILERRTYLR